MPENPTEPQRAVRLIFEYDGDQVRLVSQHPVTMVVNAAEPSPSDQPGYYVDTRDAAENTLARVAAPGAFARSLEVFPEWPDQGMMRTDIPGRGGAFTVVVPASDDAEHVAMVRVEPTIAIDPSDTTETAPVRTQAVDLASFPLQFPR